MRQGESPEALSPEARARIENEKRDHHVGVALVLASIVGALLQIWLTGDLSMTVAGACGVALMVGGNLIDPDRFNALTLKALEKLPGGRKSE